MNEHYTVLGAFFYYLPFLPLPTLFAFCHFITNRVGFFVHHKKNENKKKRKSKWWCELSKLSFSLLFKWLHISQQASDNAYFHGQKRCERKFMQHFRSLCIATYVAIYWINCAKRPSRLIIKHATSKVATRKTRKILIWWHLIRIKVITLLSESLTRRYIVRVMHRIVCRGGW